jgi:hypothetical protein
MECDRCGRPAWVRHGGMGGGIMPDDETHCIVRGGRSCRIAAHGFAAGIERGRAEALREAAEAVERAPLAEYPGYERNEPDAEGTRANCVAAIRALAAKLEGGA